MTAPPALAAPASPSTTTAPGVSWSVTVARTTLLTYGPRTTGSPKVCADVPAGTHYTGTVRITNSSDRPMTNVAMTKTDPWTGATGTLRCPTAVGAHQTATCSLLPEDSGSGPLGTYALRLTFAQVDAKGQPHRYTQKATLSLDGDAATQPKPGTPAKIKSCDVPAPSKPKSGTTKSTRPGLAETGVR